jgi:hypothetical protein
MTRHFIKLSYNITFFKFNNIEISSFEKKCPSLTYIQLRVNILKLNMCRHILVAYYPVSILEARM